jgi:hypothetical protein
MARDAVDNSFIGWIEEGVSYGDVTVVEVESPSTLVLVLLKPATVVTSLDIDETESTVVY